MIYLDLILNSTLLVALSVISNFIEQRWARHTRPGVLLQGLLFGGAAVLAMLRPLNLGPGLIFDGRSIMVSLCALFFGPWAAGVAGVMSITVRIGLGGAGTLTGVLVILSSVGIGLWTRLYVKPDEKPLSALGLYMFGIGVHLAMLAVMFTLPGNAGIMVIRRIGFPIILFYPLATVLAGKILVDQVRSGQRMKDLQESTARYDGLVALIPVGVCVFWIRANGAMEFEYVSPRWCEIHQVSREAVLSDASIADSLVHPEERDAFVTRNRQAWKLQAPFLWEGRFIIQDEIRWLKVQSVPQVMENGDIRWFGVTEDITDSKRSEEALRASEKRAGLQRAAIAKLFLDDAVSSGRMPDAIQHVTEALSKSMDVERVSVWLLSEDGLELQCLSLFEAASGRHSDGSVLQTETFPSYFEALHVEGRIVVEDAQHDLRTSELTENYLAPLGIGALLDAGIQFEGEMIGVVSLEHIGTPRAWHADEEAFVSTAAAMIAQIITNTERKKVEEEREKLQAQLHQAQKMEAVGRLAGGVAHDFNNMLAVILANTEMAMLEADLIDPLYGRLRQIQHTTERSSDLVRQLLTFARRQPVDPLLIHLNDAVEGMLKMLNRLIGEDIRLVWNPGQDLWPIRMDPSQLDQILANLCVNARDAIKDVGTIAIETQNMVLDQEYCAHHAECLPGEYVLLFVSDDGSGMEKEIVERLFEPFFTTKAEGRGTGLGLATVYGIVKQSRGFINVYSEPGQGSTFKVYLPRHYGKMEETPEERSAEQLKGGTETALLVEDEPMLLEITRSMLEKLGYTVLAAGTPSEALSAAERHGDGIHLLMTDVILPDMNGRDLSKQLLSICPDLRCLFMSGYTADVIAHHGVLDADVFFIQKPFTLQALSHKLREVLDFGHSNETPTHHDVRTDCDAAVCPPSFTTGVEKIVAS